MTAVSDILTKEFLEYHYIELDKSSTEIAKENGISKSSVLNWLKVYGIKSRPISSRTNRQKQQRFGNWRGHGEISGAYWCSIRSRAPGRNLDFSITIEEAWEVFLKQNRKCVYSGLELIFATKIVFPARTEQTASIDRIDSDKGYIPNNIQWVHKDVNKMKQFFTDERFKELCLLIGRNLESKNDYNVH